MVSDGGLPPDDHLHTQFSYDARDRGDMEGTCRIALARGIPAVAFTEHVDFADWSADDRAGQVAEQRMLHHNYAPFDLAAYLEELERCRKLFPQLRIRSGIESGEPHLFEASLRSLLDGYRPDRVLGSLHAISYGRTLRYAHTGIRELGPHEVMRRYLAEMLEMVRTCDFFEVLAHVDYPRRYWPLGLTYHESDFEEELRTVFAELAGQGRVLEINTHTPLASARMISWWYDEGGAAVSFGSDAHHPWAVADSFRAATHVAEAAGFRPGRDRFDFWRR